MPATKNNLAIRQVPIDSLHVVSALMGHANVTTTARYDLRSEGKRREAAELVHIPWPA